MEDTLEEYKNIPKLRRLAMFFTVIGPENSAEILRSFDDASMEAVVCEMAELDLIDDATQKEVLEEFSNLLLESASAIKGGYDVAMKTVETARGPNRALSLARKLGPRGDSKSLVSNFSDMSAPQLWNLLKAEQSQTVAFLLSAMESRKTADILELMEDDFRSEVVLGMGRLNPTSSDVLEKVVKNLSRHTEGHVPQPVSRLGGVQHLAEVMKLLDAAVSKNLISAIESSDAELGAQVSKEMFSFRDLIKLGQDAMQKIMREVDTPTMVMAMKSAAPELKELIFSSLSKRGAEALREELELMGPARLKEVEAAQDIILQTVRKLEEDGEISFGGEGGDQYV